MNMLCSELQLQEMTAPRTDASEKQSDNASSIEIPHALRLPSSVQDSMTLDFEEDPEIAAGVREMVMAEKQNEHAREFYSSQYFESLKLRKSKEQKTFNLHLM